jgi:hypothetical protein
MRDYQPLLTRALAGLENNTRETRQAVYDRARQALLKQLRGVEPPLAEAEITRERLALEDAIKRIDRNYAQKEAVASAPAPEAAVAGARAPIQPRPPRPLSDRPVPPLPPNRVPPEARPGRDVPPAVDLDTPEAAELARAAEPGRARAPRPGSGRAMREGERRALQAKLLVGALAVLLILVAVGLGYMNRDRIFALLGSGTTEVGDAKVPDRVAAERAPTAPAPAPAPTPAPGAVAPVGQRAVLYEENPGGGEQLQMFVGTAVWRTETVSPGPGQPPEVGLRIDIEIPDRRLAAVMTIRRNPDKNLPASHTIEVQFNTPNDPFGGVATMPGVRLKTSETAQGAPLGGLVVRVMPGFFLLGLSAVDSEREQNLQLLRERAWFDVPFVYNNGRRAVLAFEKGTPGERAVNDALAAWSK